MNLNNKVIYKINNQTIKKFQISQLENTLTFFVVSDFSKISIDEIVRLLKNNRKIIIDDNTVVDIEKIKEIKEILNDNLKFLNLYISKEAYIKLWFHKEFSNLLLDLEILEENDSDKIVKSDIPLNIGIKFKYLENPNYLLKMIDGSLYIKKLIMQNFDETNFNLKEEFEKVINFGHEIRENLIVSSNIYIERIAQTTNVICNVLDCKNNFYPEIHNIERLGLISSLEFDLDIVAKLNYSEACQIPYSVRKDFKNIGWIDAVRIKRILKKQSIRKIIIEDIENYDLLNEIKVCTEYGFNKNRTKTYLQPDNLDERIPLYTRFVGWKTITSELENPSEVPYELLYFVHELKKILEVDRIIVKLKMLQISA